MTNQQNWYKNFFNGLALDMWNQALPPAVTESEVRFIITEGGLQAGSSVLDIPCGAGRLSLPLAELGYKVTGIDISQENIQSLDRIKGMLAIHTVCGNSLEYEWKESFDLAICMGNSFNYFEYDETLLFVSKIRKALKPGAKLIVNSGAIAESILTNLKETMEFKMGELLFQMENHYHVHSSVLETNMKFTKGTRMEEKTSFHFVYTLSEVLRILKTTGFSAFNVYSDVEKSLYKFGSQQAFIVAS